MANAQEPDEMNGTICISDDDEEDDILNKPWTIDDFEYGKSLGKGRFGRVFLAKENRTKDKLLVALKVMSKNALIKNDNVDNLKRELEIHQVLKHPNVIEMYGWFYDEQKVYIILEFAPDGNLFEKLIDGVLSEHLAATYTKQTAKGLMYIHSKNVIHRDIKSENLVLGNYGEIKIADFGWAKMINEESKKNDRRSMAGTYEYLCPEMINRHVHNYKVDNWCLGVLLYEMVVGYSPFKADEVNVIYGKINQVDYEIPKTVKKGCRDLISKLLVKNANQRMELFDVIEHDWIQKFASKDEEYMTKKFYDE